MRLLLGPIIGITLVLLAVFLPASFMPGLSGQMYAQFALVIAATALISAINAVTLKPTQCALWLRPSVPMEKRNIAYRAFNAVYARAERAYTGLVRAHRRPCRHHDDRRADHHRHDTLCFLENPDRVHSDRRPGLHAGDGAVARRRFDRPHPESAGRGWATSRARRPASPRSSPSPAPRRSTTIRRCRTAARSTSSSRIGPCAARSSACCRCWKASTRRWRRSKARSCACCRRRRSRASALPPASPCRLRCWTTARISPSWRAWSTPPSPTPQRSRPSAWRCRRSAATCRNTRSR